MQNIPFNGAGRRPAPHPLLAIVHSPTVIYLYFIQSALCRICMYCALQEYVKVPVQCSWVGRAGSLPPPPAPLAEPWGGGGLASNVLPGDFERGRGDLWQASRELKWQIFLAINSADYSRG